MITAWKIGFDDITAELIKSKKKSKNVYVELIKS